MSGELTHPLGHLPHGEPGGYDQGEDVGASGDDLVGGGKAQVLVEGVGAGYQLRPGVEDAPDPVGQRSC